MSGSHNTPLVSIILPTYNRVKQIAPTIDSILSQTYSNWELIIIDDGSSDGTAELVNSFVTKDARIKFLPLEQNRGASYARNFGMDRCTGEYITFIDSDDVYHITKIEKQVNLFLTSTIPNVGIVTCGRNDYRNGKIYNSWLPSNRGNVREKLFSGVQIGAQTSFLMMSGEALNKGVRFDLNINVVEDFDLVAQILMLGYNLDYVNEHLVDVYHYDISRNFDYPRGLVARDYLYNKYKDYLAQNESVRKQFLFKSLIFYAMIDTDVKSSTTRLAFKKAHPVYSQWFDLTKNLPAGPAKSASLKMLKSAFKILG